MFCTQIALLLQELPDPDQESQVHELHPAVPEVCRLGLWTALQGVTRAKAAIALPIWVRE
jgi:hypothetical protein